MLDESADADEGHEVVVLCHDDVVLGVQRLAENRQVIDELAEYQHLVLVI